MRLGNDHSFNHEIELFIRRLNKDKLNGKISLIEWLDELTPNLWVYDLMSGFTINKDFNQNAAIV